jgi:hypothetical protein
MFYEWVSRHAGTLFAAVSGSAVQVAVAWQSPKLAARQFFIGTLMGANFGPAFYKTIEYLSPIEGPSIEYAVICAVGLGGIYAAEGGIFMWQRWRANPTLMFPWSKS